MAGSEFQTYDAMKLKEHSPKEFQFRCGILSRSFSSSFFFRLKIGESEKVRKKDKKKTLSNQERSSYSKIIKRKNISQILVSELGSCVKVEQLCESRGGSPGFPVPNKPTVSVDVKQH